MDFNFSFSFFWGIVFGLAYLVWAVPGDVVGDFSSRQKSILYMQMLYHLLYDVHVYKCYVYTYAYIHVTKTCITYVCIYVYTYIYIHDVCI